VNPRLSREDALIELRALRDGADPESAHGVADGILLAVIGDEEITEAYDNIEKWYA
jgi:hypothetical protein